MPYVEKVLSVDRELERLHRELEQAANEPERKRITAAMTVLRRQRRWYLRRSPRPSAAVQPDQR